MIRQFLQRLRSPAATRSAESIAIVLQSDCIRLLQLQRYPLQVKKLNSLPVSDPSAWPQQLHRLCAEIPAHIPLCLVLPASHYQLLVVDRPAVPDDEIPAALPWLVAELSDTNAQELVMDYLQLPDIGHQRGKLQVVVTPKQPLQALCKVLQRRQLQLVNIQPDEWLVRNLVPTIGVPFLVLSQQPGQDVSILILQHGQVYFSRKLRGYSQLAQYDVSDLTAGVLENLMLEIQRSMDYFEGQLRQPPIRDIYLLLPDQVEQALQQYLQQNGFGQVHQIDISGIMAAFGSLERGDYWLALAGALEVLTEDNDEATR